MSAEPTSPSGAERRRGPRVNRRVAIRISWHDAGADRSEDTHTIAISQFGCGVESAQNIPPGTVLELSCEGRRIQGKLSYVLRSSRAAHFELGIGFARDGSEFWGVTF